MKKEILYTLALIAAVTVAVLILKYLGLTDPINAY